MVETVCFNVLVGTLVEKDNLGDVPTGRNVGCILDLACLGSVPRAFGSRKRPGYLLDTYSTINFRKDAYQTVDTVCPGKTKNLSD